MNKKLIVRSLFLSLSAQMVFCAEIIHIKEYKKGRATITVRRKRKPETLNGNPEAKKQHVSLSPLEQQELDLRLWQGIENRDVSLDEMRRLLAAKANPNMRNDANRTSLFHLVGWDSYGSEFGQNVYYSQQSHEQCLHFDSEVLGVLLEHNADPNLRSGRGKDSYTPLGAMVKDPYLQSCGGSVHYDGSFNIKCLKTNLKRTKKLLEHGANPNLGGGEHDQSALHLALVDLFARVFQSIPSVNNPFHWVYLDWKKKIIEVLLDAKADVNMPDAHNNRPLHQAVAGGHYPTVALLLEHDARTEVRNQDGLMPIHVAVVTPFHFLTGIALLQYDGNLNAETIEGDTVLSLDRSGYSSEVIQEIKKRKIERNKFLLSIFRNLNVPLFSKLIAANANVDQVDAIGETPLMYAARETQSLMGLNFQEDGLAVVKLLLDAQADPRIEKNDGTTALVLASDEGKQMIRNSILAKKRKKVVEILFREFSGKKLFEPNVIELILALAGTYEPI